MQVWMPFSIRHCGMPVKVVCFSTNNQLYVHNCKNAFYHTHKKDFESLGVSKVKMDLSVQMKMDGQLLHSVSSQSSG